jgi:hypothetical protein
MTGIKGINVGNNNGMWKGDSVSYISLHQWVKYNKPKPELCECCGLKTPYDLANISQEYKRDIDDYEWLCRKCHMKKDGRLDNIIKSLKVFRSKNDIEFICRECGKTSFTWNKLKQFCSTACCRKHFDRISIKKVSERRHHVRAKQIANDGHKMPVL